MYTSQRDVLSSAKTLSVAIQSLVEIVEKFFCYLHQLNPSFCIYNYYDYTMM